MFLITYNEEFPPSKLHEVSKLHPVSKFMTCLAVSRDKLSIYISSTIRLIAIKHGKKVIYGNHVSRLLARLLAVIKTLYPHYHKTYGHQNWEGGELP